MSLIFVDTSALLKRYIIEPGSLWVQSWIASAAGNQIVIAEIAITETLATLARFRRERRLSTANFDRLRDDFLAHADQDYLVDRLDTALLAVANDLVLRHRCVRSMRSTSPQRWKLRESSVRHQFLSAAIVNCSLPPLPKVSLLTTPTTTSPQQPSCSQFL